MSCCPIINGEIDGGGGNGNGGNGMEDFVCDTDNNSFGTDQTSLQATGKKLTTPDVAAGTYRFGVAYTWEQTLIGEFRMNVRLDGGSLVFQETQDQRPRRAGDIHVGSRFICLDLAAGVHEFEIVIASSDSTEDATIHQTTMEFWRV